MTPRYAAGAAVRVAGREHDGHVRTPRYIRGKRGVVESVCGAFGNPEEPAYGSATLASSRSIACGSLRATSGPVTPAPRRIRSTLNCTSTGSSRRRCPHESHARSDRTRGVRAGLAGAAGRARPIRRVRHRRARRVALFADAALGARVVARAWFDPQYKARLLRDANAAVSELGIGLGNTRLVVVENTPKVHNVIVCTLCSCTRG